MQRFSSALNKNDVEDIFSEPNLFMFVISPDDIDEPYATFYLIKNDDFWYVSSNNRVKGESEDEYKARKSEVFLLAKETLHQFSEDFITDGHTYIRKDVKILSSKKRKNDPEHFNLKIKFAGYDLEINEETPGPSVISTVLNRFSKIKPLEITDLFSMGFLQDQPILKPFFNSYFGLLGLYILTYEKSPLIGNRSLQRKTFFRQKEEYSVINKNASPLEMFGALTDTINRQCLTDNFIAKDFVTDLINSGISDDVGSFALELGRFIFERPYYFALNRYSLQQPFLVELCYYYLFNKELESGDYNNALLHQRFVTHKGGIRDEESHAAFVAKYILKKHGRAKVAKFLNDFFSIDHFADHSHDFLTAASAYFNEDLKAKFAGDNDIVALTSVGKSAKSKISTAFAYPYNLVISDEALISINDLILKDKLDEDTIKRLYHYIFINSDPRVDIYYSGLKHVASKTKEYSTLFTCGDVLNMIWMYAGDEKWIRHEIYNIFWPRIGGMTGFKKCLKQCDDKLKSEIMGWLLSISKEDGEKMPEAFTYFEEIAKSDIPYAKLPDCARFSVFDYRLEHSPLPRDIAGFATFSAEGWISPARLVTFSAKKTDFPAALDVLFSDTPHLKQTINDFIDHMHNPEICGPTLDYFAKNSDTLINTLDAGELANAFEAACLQIDNDKDIPAVESLAKSLSFSAEKLNASKEYLSLLEKTPELARAAVKTHKTLRKNLRKLETK